MNKLTSTELEEVRVVMRTMINWGTGGMYGDGEDITDKKGLATAKRALDKLDLL